MVMDARTPEVAEFLLLIEQEMRTQGLWSDKTPTEHDLSSLEPFSVDRLDFELWVQWIFLPKMKVIVEQGQPLPNVSGIRHMADQVFAQRRGNWRPLLKHFEGFDQLISPSA
ncbi:hypothetical protein CF149_11655 [Pseudomonas psychrophila]|jgi:uncharacterized protein YqcC (DUF446 family)|nr:hypothetical protein CF149_11655 [Pseudomonas psychrophila]